MGNILNCISKEEKIVRSTEGKRKKFGSYMIGSTAYHLLGDISREECESENFIENLLYASEETDDYYIGSWITGFGFFDVHFPKSTTRELTEKEIKKINGKYNGFGRERNYIVIGNHIHELQVNEKYKK